MFAFSDDPFDNLLAQIRDYSPNCVPLLQHLREDCGRQAGYYAAFVFICLNAITEKQHDKPPGEFTTHDFREYAFFDMAQDDPHALVLFDKLLETYKRDRVTAQP